MGDAVHMERAIELARRGAGLVSPNPLVGAVVVSSSGEVVGEGFHERAGESHAEVRAIEAAGDRARGGTLYCTLEPCAHFGRTPPCTDAIVAAGIGRVVVAMRDPNPIVDGRGIAALVAAGVAVEEGPLRERAEEINRAFVRHVRTGMPYVTWKIAASLDGKVAAADGSSRWITGEEARAEVHRLRAESDAVLTGAGTILADDPSLTARDPDYRGEPALRVVVDSAGRVPADRKVFDASAPTLVATTSRASAASRDAWSYAGAEVVEFSENEAGGVALGELAAHLGKRDVQGVLLECGPGLGWAMVAEDLVDRVILHTAPLLVGGSDAPGVLGGVGFAPISDARRLVIDHVGRIGADVRVEAHVHRDS